MFRVQFSVSSEEQEVLEAAAREEGYPTITELCKARALGIDMREHSYLALYKLMLVCITELKAGEEFYLRDILPAPPALLGRWLFDGVAAGRIPNVRVVEAVRGRPARYLKI